MSRTPFAACLLLVLGAGTALAQPTARRPGGNSLPAVGTMLPTVEAFDDQGQVVSTASLRGSYTVLVFGCLT